MSRIRDAYESRLRGGEFQLNPVQEKAATALTQVEDRTWMALASPSPTETNADATVPVSVLWPDDTPAKGAESEPACFVDLNLDQIVKEVLTGFEAYDLTSIFWTSLTSAEAVRYRQAVMADVDDPDVLGVIRAFSGAMDQVRRALARAEKLYDERQQQRWFLDAAERYVEAVRTILRSLLASTIHSPALRRFRDYLNSYASSARFSAMAADIDRITNALGTVRYKVHVRGLQVEVGRDEGEEDYSQAILRTFDRFRQGGGREFKFKFPEYGDMNNVESSILEQLSKIHPDIFDSLAAFRSSHLEFQDACVIRFDREIQVYVAYLDYIAPLRAAGLSFSLPDLAGPEDALDAQAVFDLALARKMGSQKLTPVANDFHLSGPERIIVVSGPNQGGKTTFARAFGQIHWLANLGLPVPAERAVLRQFDHLFTHFERGENTADLRGKLADDLVRVHEMLAAATSRTVIIFNEMFTSTTFRDALGLSKAIMRKLVDGRLTALWVTFIDELASWNEHTVSMVSNVDPEDLSKRTFKVVRRPADGLAYALSIAQKWGVSLPQIRERFRR